MKPGTDSYSFLSSDGIFSLILQCFPNAGSAIFKNTIKEIVVWCITLGLSSIQVVAYLITFNEPQESLPLL